MTHRGTEIRKRPSSTLSRTHRNECHSSLFRFSLNIIYGNLNKRFQFRFHPEFFHGIQLSGKIAGVTAKIYMKGQSCTILIANLQLLRTDPPHSCKLVPMLDRSDSQPREWHKTVLEISYPHPCMNAMIVHATFPHLGIQLHYFTLFPLARQYFKPLAQSIQCLS